MLVARMKSFTGERELGEKIWGGIGEEEMKRESKEKVLRKKEGRKVIDQKNWRRKKDMPFF